MSRAQWLAFGSTIAIAGCSGQETQTETPNPQVASGGDGTQAAAIAMDGTIPTDTPNPQVESGDDGAQDELLLHSGASGTDAPVDADTDASMEAGLIVATDAQFRCYGGVGIGTDMLCNAATQWCLIDMGGAGAPSGCEAFDITCLGDSGPDGSCSSTLTWELQKCDGGYRSCACLTLNCGGYPGSAQCTDQDGGGVTVSCGHCYGAPPARLERLARSSARANLSRRSSSRLQH